MSDVALRATEADRTRPGRARWGLGALLALGLASLGLVAGRTSLLRAAGDVLVAGDPLMPADVVVVATGADAAGVLEAADLVQAGVAPRAAVLADPPDPADEEFLRRGLPYEDAAARQRRQLHALGVADVEQVPRAVSGTEDEAGVLPGWCDQHGFRAIVVVTTSDHSRRLRRVLGRAFTDQAASTGHAARLAVRPSRYSRFDPDRWWLSRAGTRTGIVELEKLLLDVVRHPW